MFFFIDEARSRPPPCLLTNVNKKMVFFIEGFPNNHIKDIQDFQDGFIKNVLQLVLQVQTPI